VSETARRGIPLSHFPGRGGEKRGGLELRGEEHAVFKPFKAQVAP